MNRQQILSRLARKHEVLYSNGPWTIWDRAKATWRACPFFGAFVRLDGVWVDRSPRLLLSWPPGWLDRWVQRLAQSRWRRKLARMGEGQMVLYVFHPRFASAVQGMPHDLLVYHPYDLFRRMPGWTPALAEQERWLLQHADRVIATSRSTRDLLALETSHPPFWVPNGVDAAVFAPGAQGTIPDVERIPRPRLGYVGSVNQKLDLGLVAHLARARPDWHWVIIGPEGLYDAPTRAAREDCRTLANVYFLGNQPRDLLPACMAALDVGLLCYRSGTWMDGAYPLKLSEYLACGLPVVSSDLAEVRPMQNVLTIARSPADWEAAIGAALAGKAPGTVAERRALATQYDWNTLAVRLTAILTTARAEPRDNP